MAFAHFVHLIAAAALFGISLCDVFFLRSWRSEIVSPQPLIQLWRKRTGLLQMLLFIFVLGFGLWMWLPRIALYTPGIYHTKAGLALVYLILAKLRMLRERKKGVQVGMTRVMALILTLIFSLGALGGVL